LVKTRILGAAVGIVAVVGGSLVASPAQATDGFDSARVYYKGDSGSGGYVRADIDFLSRTEVVYRDFTVRDVCPGDGLPVRAQISWRNADGTFADIGSWKADNNGCGPNGTNFGDIRISRPKALAKATLTVCVYDQSIGNLRCATSGGRDNPYV
jgi:hypothetical protein